MTRKPLMIAAMVAVLAAIAVLPAMAGGTGESTSRATVAAGSELTAFFAERGVDPRYLGLEKSQIPEEQWSRINEIVAAANVESDDTETLDYDDDHDVLNSLVFESLYAASDTAGETVYLTLGDTTWGHTLEATDDDTETDIYGFPVSGIYPTPRS